MTKEELIKGVAAALRRIDNKPDFLLYIGEEFVFDNNEFDYDAICGIPVLYSFANLAGKPEDIDCDILPLWKSSKKHFYDVYSFWRGFDEVLIEFKNF